jgi:hypothetical protein
MIPKEHIEENLKLINELENIRYIHFRELNTTINTSNFHICTSVDFKKIENTHDNIHETWDFGVMKQNLIYQHKSPSGSEYAITENGDVFRYSNHWGAVKSCKWMLEGNGNLLRSVFEYGEWEIGKANLSEFKIFRWKEDRNIDILLNPVWIENIKSLIPFKDNLQLLIKNPEFKSLTNEDKHLIGSTFGLINSLIHKIQ